MKISVKILLILLLPTCFICKNLQAQNTFPSTGSAGIGTMTKMPLVSRYFLLSERYKKIKFPVIK